MVNECVERQTELQLRLLLLLSTSYKHIQTGTVYLTNLIPNKIRTFYPSPAKGLVAIDGRLGRPRRNHADVIRGRAAVACHSADW